MAAYHNSEDDKNAEQKGSEAAPPSAQNPDDKQSHGGEHSPNQAKGGASDSDKGNG